MICNILKQVGRCNQPDVRGEISVEFFFGVSKPVYIQTVGNKNPQVEGEIIDFLLFACNETNFHLQREEIMNLYIFIYHTWIM